MTTDKGVWNIQQVRDKQLQSLWDYSAAITMMVWGQNGGMLGLNSTTPTATHTQLPGSWSHIEANPDSNTHVGGVKTDGTLWTWGGNQYGAGGYNQNIDAASSPIQIPGTTWSIVVAGKKNMGATKTD